MSAKKTILILCDWFLPGYLAGGPIQSIVTLTQQLGLDIDFKIITTDRDFKSNAAYTNIKINEWTQFEGRTVFYISPENMNEAFILKLIQHTKHDTIYLNSLFSKHFSINPLKWKSNGKITSKLILAPRGMLGDGALSVKPLKKKLFLMYAQLIGLYKGIHWQSTSLEETENIKKRIASTASIIQVSNVPAITHTCIAIEKKQGILRLCFIARILEVKNLQFAIQVLQEIKTANIILDIYGPKEDKMYWDICFHNIRKLPNNIQCTYQGVLMPSQIANTISKYHALFLPTHTENFGHIIVETLQCSRPVIISNQTPWRHLESINAGFDIDLQYKNKFVNAIEKLAQLNQTEFDAMSQASKTYINNELNIQDIKNKYIKLFS